MYRGYTTTDEIKKLKSDQKRLVIEQKRFNKLVRTFSVMDDRTKKELESISARYSKLITDNGKTIKRIRQKNADKITLIMQSKAFDEQILPLYTQVSELEQHAYEWLKSSNCNMSSFVKVSTANKVVFYYGFSTFIFEPSVTNEKYTKGNFKNKFLNKIADKELASFLSTTQFGYNKGDAVKLTDNFKLTIVL